MNFINGKQVGSLEEALLHEGPDWVHWGWCHICDGRYREDHAARFFRSPYTHMIPSIWASRWATHLHFDFRISCLLPSSSVLTMGISLHKKSTP